MASITRKEKDSKASDTVIIKRKRANCESFKFPLQYTGIVLQLVDGFEILSFSSKSPVMKGKHNEQTV